MTLTATFISFIKIRNIVFQTALLFFTVFISACFFVPELKVHPKSIKPIILNEEVHIKFTVQENRTPVGGIHLKEGTLPTGLYLDYNRTDSDSFNPRLAIKGKALELGDYYFSLYIWCYGTNFPGQNTIIPYHIEVITP